MTDAAAPNPAQPAPAPPAEKPATAKVVQLRAAVQERAGALNDWAHDQARTLATTAREKPLAAAGVSAGAAFAAGLVLGLLIARAGPEPSWKERILDLRPHW
ncbi:MAG TPA: hypothetical protein VL358_15595 [Caulobacteraceae bacterium]|jgi:ElaB/YqjD/DUF883 family membrane-anchored ribosome-binding protein|nr:hypothetical protein [Caulobacteraceae bacterium]